MILVILGAGASFDANPRRPAGMDDPHRLPLTKDLFSDRFASILSRFPLCHPIVPYLRPNDRQSLEQTLQSLLKEGTADPQRLIQIAAVQFYLQGLLWDCQANWLRAVDGPTNYLTLLDQLRRHASADLPVTLVSYNYDQLLETALKGFGVRLDSFDDYLSHSIFRLVKPHGSVNWGREVTLPEPYSVASDPWTAVDTLTQAAAIVQHTDRFHLTTGWPAVLGDGHYVMPALAVPIQDKQDFVCPAGHTAALLDALPLVERMVVVGWRAADTAFLTHLAAKARRPIPTFVAVGSDAEGKDVARRIRQAGAEITETIYPGGFSEMIVSRALEAFLGPTR